MQFTIKQYEKAIKQELTKEDIEILLILFCNPKISTAPELSKLLNPSAKGHIIANKKVGKIGRRIAGCFPKIEIPEYNDGRKETPAYFSLIGEYDKVNGWMMRGNLRTALSKIITTKIPGLIVDQRKKLKK